MHIMFPVGLKPSVYFGALSLFGVLFVGCSARPEVMIIKNLKKYFTFEVRHKTDVAVMLPFAQDVET